MYPALSSTEIYVTWRKTLVQGPQFSRHAFLVVIANFLSYLGMAMLYQRYHADPNVGQYLSIFILFMVFVVNFLGYYMLEAYKYVRRQMLSQDCTETHARDLLFISYAAFRLYFVGLMVFFILMAVASQIPKG
jgi:hypothetical protein